MLRGSRVVNQHGETAQNVSLDLQDIVRVHPELIRRVGISTKSRLRLLEGDSVLAQGLADKGVHHGQAMNKRRIVLRVER